MNLEQENALLKRQLNTALTALERIQAHTVCPDPEGCVPRYSCAQEVSSGALGDIRRAAETKDAPDWGVKFIAIGDNGWRADFFVAQQSFTFFNDQESEDGKDVLDHAKWFKDMLFNALARLGVDTSTAKERTEQG